MDAEEGAYVEDWKELNVQELREELAARQLDTSGKKTDLVARLEADDAEADESEAEQGESPGPVEPVEGAEHDAPGPDAVDPGESPEEPEEAVADSPATYRVVLDVPDDYDGEEEWDIRWKLEARAAAVNAGHVVFPAVYSAYLVGFSSQDGRQTVTYEVPLVQG